MYVFLGGCFLFIVLVFRLFDDIFNKRHDGEERIKTPPVWHDVFTTAGKVFSERENAVEKRNSPQGERLFESLRKK